MELLLTTEQAILRDAAKTFAHRRNGIARLRSDDAETTSLNKPVWQEAADAGWLAVLVSEKHGGLGLSLTELCLIGEELGKTLVPEPITTGAAVAAALAGSSYTEKIVDGTLVCMPGLTEGPRTIGDELLKSRATCNDTGLYLTGQKVGITLADVADSFIISADSPEGPVLAYVLGNKINIHTVPTLDGATLGTLSFVDTPGAIIANTNEYKKTISTLLDTLHISTAAELLGVMEAAQDITVEYLKTREQFDRPIGSFQALQHKAVDNLATIELCRSLIYQAANAFDQRGNANGLASATLSRTIMSALNVCKSAIQLHGGIGFTDEHDIGLYLKRAMSLSARYGNSGLHRKRYAEQVRTDS